MGGFLSTSCTPIDEMLDGGFRFGEVSLIYGEAATGKTTLALGSAINHLREDPLAKGYYIDSDSKISFKRLIQVTNSDQGLLERLFFWQPKNLSNQTALIEQLYGIATRKQIPLVVDSITRLYRLELIDSSKTLNSNKELNRQLGFLSETAKTKDAAVLVVGQVHSVLDSSIPEIEPVAQRLLKYWSDKIIRLERTSLNSVMQAIMEKPYSKASRFKIGEYGLEKVTTEW
jgi:DNA repair protein RadB